ncbi:unnamed protein product [Phaedon cochleariae]|uniref:Receptor-type tyrosine-protein phosphatase N2 n=1 Tax=Phaedon cochleariae TaxID=80249 RepID=A0A9N9SCG8_PHACE|nr:unnamed protein product [Phaedon cochleariae]
MLWPGVSLRIAVLFLAATIPPGIKAEGNVGCLFGEKLCLDQEWCYDDMAFGRCLRPMGDVDEDDLYRFDLERQSLHELSAELRRLFALGYRWSHGYTQCRLQTMLYAVKNDITFEPDSCFHLSDNDLEGALRAIEGQVDLDPQEVAIIKYTPSVDDPHASYADEVYFPPLRNRPQEEVRERILPSNAIDLDIQDPYADYAVLKRSWIPQMRRRSLPNTFPDPPSIDFRRRDARDDLEFLQNDFPSGNSNRNPPVSNQFTYDDITEMYPLIKFLNELRLTPKELHDLLQPENAEQLEGLVERFDNDLSTYTDNQEDMRNQLDLEKETRRLVDDTFNLNYNTPDSFREGWESKDTMRDAYYLPESRMYYEENDEENSEHGSGHPEVADTNFRERKTEDVGEDPSEKQLLLGRKFNDRELEDDRKVRPGVYSEGGVVWTAPIEDNRQEVESEMMFRNSLDTLLKKYNLGFKRPERLDVKKPGPPFDSQITETPQEAEDYKHRSAKSAAIPSMMKKGPPGAHPYPEYELRGENNLNYVYVGYENGLEAWKQGDRIVGNISSLLHLEPSAFVDGRTNPYSLYFKVRPNSRGLNASEVAKKIELLKDRIKEITGVKITSVGVGDRENEQQVLFKHLTDDSQYYIAIYSICGVLAAIMVASVLLFFIVRHIKSREKLQGIARPDTEASKDYQDLCRARMATKTQPAAGDHGKIASLSKESEQSPSSRSSTSSWSEEPALHNMDISTGHMVLTYMEDHLKNKDRLEQEWVALCAYVAEPCDTTIAHRKENKDKNRYHDVVPYDHSRVLLNSLTNANGSDYVNASSITDHDPRNPAYIATHGSLPHTVADFWQLIWEQGAVVIVMLTRLTEGGSAMCHRYWPEEGSELYHIYEVHLVSEHIWCDDYLVRSFYLKNMKTGETRTVTQFHFLSWPESGVPSSTKALLEFRRKVNKSYRGRSCPIVVHCSDGAGRTGTYCLIDMVLSRMAKGAKEIDIAATLEHLRDQRPKMVATKQQFEFVLTAVAEEVHAILKALPPQASPVVGQEKEK